MSLRPKIGIEPAFRKCFKGIIKPERNLTLIGFINILLFSKT